MEWPRIQELLEQRRVNNMVAVTSLVSIIISALMMTASAPILLDLQIGGSDAQNRQLIQAAETANSLCPENTEDSESEVRSSERLAAPPPGQAFKFEGDQVFLLGASGSQKAKRSLDCSVEEKRVEEGGWRLSREGDEVVFGS